ncbi:GTPase [Streptomyces sp. NPDC060194]|uniref:GTPase n=1 Tax=Streptomyces sp. NPDC060194 TaxID=3347069 RepID=UPI003653FB15
MGAGPGDDGSRGDEGAVRAGEWSGGVAQDVLRAGGRPVDGGPGDDRADGDRTGAPAPRPGWDDGLIARRASPSEESARSIAAPAAPDAGISGESARTPGPRDPAPRAPREAAARRDGGPESAGILRGSEAARIEALKELVGLSRTRLEGDTLAEAGRVLDEAAARGRLSADHTVVALAGATGSGKSTLFNALAGTQISEAGVRRPTTSAPIACSWSDGAAGLLDRLGVAGRLRRRPILGASPDPQLRGLVLVDLPDHDSAVTAHRDEVDRVLRLVDAVIWVVDPEKYADAVLHERYLRPMAGHAEVTFVVLNQIDRLAPEAADAVLDDLRRLLDDDGVALGEHGEPGAHVMALSALTGEGVGELREVLGQFTHERGAPARRIAADLDAAAAGLRPVYVAEGPTGLSEFARERFADRLAEAVGAVAVGRSAERAWRRNAGLACGTPWLRFVRECGGERWAGRSGRAAAVAPRGAAGEGAAHAGGDGAQERPAARQQVEQAVRELVAEAGHGLPGPWAQAVREAAARGAEELPEALDEVAVTAEKRRGTPPRPSWWAGAVLTQTLMAVLQLLGVLWLVGQVAGALAPELIGPFVLLAAGTAGGPLAEWVCALAARGPARRYGAESERRLRDAAAGCGRARVLDPVAAELLRYQEVREQYGTVAGPTTPLPGLPGPAAPAAAVGADLRRG